MATKKKIKLAYTPIEKGGYGYGVGEYKYSYNIAEYDCNTSYIDNKTIIGSGKITKINQLALYQSISSRMSIKSIKDYCLDRFVNKKFTNDVVSFVIRNGYYGDEANYEVAKSFSEELNSFIDRLNNDKEDETKLIEEVLLLEYGYILPELKDKTWIFYDKIPLNQINPAAGMRHVDFKIVNRYKKEYIENKYNLTCLCDNGRRLIDGYHRYSAATQLLLKNISVIEGI